MVNCDCERYLGNARGHVRNLMLYNMRRSVFVERTSGMKFQAKQKITFLEVRVLLYSDDEFRLSTEAASGPISKTNIFSKRKTLHIFAIKF